jgi:hypothetical protein
MQNKRMPMLLVGEIDPFTDYLEGIRLVGFSAIPGIIMMIGIQFKTGAWIKQVSNQVILCCFNARFYQDERNAMG